jgi:anti-sigma factor RsiW
MSDRGTIDELRLQAYVDGELPEQERAAIEESIARDPLLARQIAQYGADKTRLVEFYGRVRVEPLPAKWIELIENSPRRSLPAFPARAIAAIAAVLLLMIGGMFVFQRSVPRQDSIIEEALAARNEAIPARQTIAVASATHAGTADRLIASALAMRVRTPDLSRMGYALTGVRVYANVPGGKSVELLYRKSGAQVFALYLRRPSGPARFDQFKQGRLRVCIWQDDVLGTVMTGEISAAEMQRLASLAYTGLES